MMIRHRAGRHSVSEIASEIENRIALIRLVRPGGNALLPGLRKSLLRTLRNAAQDDGIDGIVLTGTGTTFSSGVDLREYDQEISPPTVGELALAIEDHPKPVVAALNGTTLEAGFELALAAHARVARTGSRVALPQVALGMVPSGGATQRLPRLVGAQTALEMLLSGRSFAVEDPKLAPLFDAVTQELPLRRAQSLLRQMADQGDWTRSCDSRLGFADTERFQSEIAIATRRVADTDGVEADIVHCVEAAILLPFHQGLNLENTAFESRRVSTASRARRHIFAAERIAARQIARLDARARPIKVIAAIGDDPRLPALIVACLDRCEDAVLFAENIDMARRLAENVDAILEAMVERRRLSEEMREEFIDRLSLSDDVAVLKDVDLIFDASGAWSGVAGETTGAIWCVLDETTNAIEQARRTGAETLTLRPYRPAHASSLAEIELSENTRPDAAATVARFFVRMGRTVICHSDASDMTGHDLMIAAFAAALGLARHGIEPQALESAARDLGFQRGFLDMIEREGAGAVLSRLARLLPNAPGADWLEARAEFMKKNWPGAGALYSDGPEGRAIDPDLSAWLATWRERAGIESKAPVVPLEMALHAALVNRAASLIRAGRLRYPHLADLCLVRGYGLSRDSGGLLFQADIGGLLPLLRAMKSLAHLSPVWEPDPLISDMIKNGATFFKAGLVEE